MNGLFGSIQAVQGPPHRSKLGGCGSPRSRLLHSLEPTLSRARGCGRRGGGHLGPRLRWGWNHRGWGLLLWPLELDQEPLGLEQRTGRQHPHTQPLVGAQAVVQELQQTGKKLTLSAWAQKPAAPFPSHSVEKDTRPPSSKGRRPGLAKAGEDACPVPGG